MTATAAGPETRTLAPRGELCEDTIAPFAAILAAESERGGRSVLVDLREVTLLSAAALRVLVSARGRLRDRGADLQVANPSPLSARVLAICGLDDLVTQ